MTLQEQLRQVLLNEDPFRSDQALRAIFVDDRLSPWRSHVPDADTPAARVDRLLAFLQGKRTSDGELALVIFLRVCAGLLDSGDANHDRLLRLAQALAERPELIDANPYRGLHHFREEDAGRFFGRERAVSHILSAVDRKPRLATLLGTSGSGKSSIVFAGLIPSLRKMPGWHVLTFRPGHSPMRSLAAALVDGLAETLTRTERLVEVGKMASALEERQLTVSQVLHDVQGRRDVDRILLLVDQFEEIFTLSTQEVQQHFFDLLLDEPAPVTRVLVIRADFLGQALEQRFLADALQGTDLMLGPMNRQELRRAIEQPALQAGARFEKGLVDRILNDLEGEPGSLPLLQFALTELWRRQATGRLTHAAYGAVGGVVGALAGYAEETYRALDTDQRTRARQLFVQLVRPGVGTADTRRVARRKEFNEAQWMLAQALASKRLVVTGQDPTGKETVEVAHEALIQRWERLQGWMAEDRSFRAWQDRLRVLRRHWEESNEDPSVLLRGKPLLEAEDWLHKRGKELSLAERDYIELSIELREARRARLKESRNQIQELRQEKAVLTGRIEEMTAALDTLERRREKAQAEQEIYASMVENRDKLEVEQMHVRQSMLKLDNHRRSMAKGSERVCPLCRQEVDDKHLRAMIAEFQAEGKNLATQFRANRDLIQELSVEMEELGKFMQDLSILEEESVELQKRLAAARIRLAEVEAMLREHAASTSAS